ncbi:Prolamin-like domain - like 4 [Theobroma cacao]|nr:Prolamin-like domain - like 4 [Theobroma cacao]
MGSFQQTLMLFLTLAFAMAITPAFSVVGWEERYMPNPWLCWGQINKPDGCLHEVYASLVEKNVNLSRECCEAVQGLSLRCKIWVFNRGRFTPEFGYCATFGITLAPSYRVYYPMDNPSGQL